MAGDEIVADGSRGQIVVRQENPRESAGKKKRNEAEREKHGGVEMDARVPKCAEPAGKQNQGGQTERRSQKRKDERRKGIHAATEHVLAPNAKTEDAHATQRQNNDAFLPDRLAGKRGNDVRDRAEAGEHGGAAFGLRERPEGQTRRKGKFRQNDTSRRN